MAVQVLLMAAAGLLALLRVQEVTSDAVPWTYTEDGGLGPENWKDNYPDCDGVMQSPIDVNTDRVLYNKYLEPFNLTDYRKTHDVAMKLVNEEGHTAEVKFSGVPLYIQGGGLPDKYKLDQFHFHWGKEDTQGSEHSLNGERFPMEMHFVHHQSHLDNTSNAASHPYGLAVIAFFFKIGDHNKNFDQLLNHFHLITDAGKEITIPTFPLADLVPNLSMPHFYRYYGSLTTPPCYESVIWSLASDHIAISEAQLETFRKLYDEEKHELADDFRPTQKLNHRFVQSTNPKYIINDGLRLSSSILALFLTVVLSVSTLLRRSTD